MAGIFQGYLLEDTSVGEVKFSPEVLTKLNRVSELDEKVDESTLANYALKTEIPDVSMYATTVYVNQELSDKADLVNGIVPESQLPASITVNTVFGTAQGVSTTTDPTTGAILITATGFNDLNGNAVIPDQNVDYFGTTTNLTFKYNPVSAIFVAQGSGAQLGETSSTAYRGDRGKTSYDWVVSHPNVENTSDLGKPISTATQTALNGKEPVITPGTTAQYLRGDKTWQTLPVYIVPVASSSAQALAGTDNTTFITPARLRDVLATLDSPIPNRASAVTQTTSNTGVGTTYTASSDGVVVIASIAGVVSAYTYTINGTTRNYASSVVVGGYSSFSFVVKAGDTYSWTGQSGVFMPFYKLYGF